MAQAAVRRNQELEIVLGLIREAVRRLDFNGIRVARASHPKVDPCKSSYRKAYSVLSQRLCPHCDWIIGFFVLPDKRLNLTARMGVFDLSPVC
jgi:hypothetical protein